MESNSDERRNGAVEYLKTNWSRLHVLDRAKRIKDIKQTGVSLRALAKALGCSQSSLRHALKAAEAPPLERLSARKTKISARELVRRSKAALAARARKDGEELENKRMQMAHAVSTAICDWLKEEDISPVYGEKIVDEAKRLLVEQEESGRVLPHPAPAGTPMTVILDRLRPPQPTDDGLIPMAWYAEWLVRSVFFALPDSLSRHRALNLALDIQIKR